MKTARDVYLYNSVREIHNRKTRTERDWYDILVRCQEFLKDGSYDSPNKADAPFVDCMWAWLCEAWWHNGFPKRSASAKLKALSAGRCRYDDPLESGVFWSIPYIAEPGVQTSAFDRILEKNPDPVSEESWRRSFGRIYAIVGTKIRYESLRNELRRVLVPDDIVTYVSNDWLEDAHSEFVRAIGGRLGNRTGWKHNLANCAKALRDAKSAGYGRILYIEDDIRFLSDLRAVGRVVNGIPDDDVVFLDYANFGSTVSCRGRTGTCMCPSEAIARNMRERKTEDEYIRVEKGTACCSAGCVALSAKAVSDALLELESRAYDRTPYEILNPDTLLSVLVARGLTASYPAVNLAVQVYSEGSSERDARMALSKYSGISVDYSLYEVPEGYDGLTTICDPTCSFAKRARFSWCADPFEPPESVPVPARVTEKQNAAYDALLRVSTELWRYGIRWYATGGTVIGAAVYGDFVPWDDDVDVLIGEESVAKFESDVVPSVENAGYVVIRTKPGKFYQIVRGNDPVLDVFFLEDMGECFGDLSSDFVRNDDVLKKRQIYPKSWFSGVSFLPFRGIGVPVPSGYREYLKQRYGLTDFRVENQKRIPPLFASVHPVEE